MTCEGEKFTAPINRMETYFVNRLSQGTAADTSRGGQGLSARTVNAGRPFRMPYVASALPSLVLKRRSAPVLVGTHLAEEFTLRNFVISLSERSVPFARA